MGERTTTVTTVHAKNKGGGWDEVEKTVVTTEEEWSDSVPVTTPWPRH